MLHVHQTLSGISGSISLACWLFVLAPQLLQNYLSQSADGISLTFLFIWFIGDFANLLGASLAHLVPTAIALALYFCAADVVLITQILYYNHMNSRQRHVQDLNQMDTEDRLDRPLLSPRPCGIDPPGFKRRSSVSQERHGHVILQINPESSHHICPWLKNTLSVLTICALGGLGWFIALLAGFWKPTIENPNHNDPAAQMLGYFSALLYLGARIPQILKNYRESSCEGLSILFFILSLLGNLSYGGSIISYSLEKEYIMKNLPWLIGSLGTVSEDVIIFTQFYIYAGDEEICPALDG